MHIRRATEADIPALIALQREGWLGDYREVIPPGYGALMAERYADPERTRRQLARYAYYDVLEEDGCVAGVVAGDLIGPGEAEIWWLHVAGPARGRGHGARLVAHFDRQLPPAVTALYVTTYQDYPRTIGFYERIGFRPVAACETIADGFTLRDLRLRRDRPAPGPKAG
jgi:ribosomal protein S18 acetylase RimI-like enzyme